MCTNRNKQSVTIDITRGPRGRSWCGARAQQSDVLVENFKTGVGAIRGWTMPP